MQRKIILATHNQGKIVEFKQLLGSHDWTLVSQQEYAVPEIDETGSTFSENALLKARHAAQLTGLPALADDSGLCVDVLKGAPGIYSARYAGEHGNNLANIAKLLTELTDVSIEERHAYFLCCLAYVSGPDDPQPLICIAKWHGSILFSPQGKYGFGYDPIFYVPEHHCSVAELIPAIKNRLSHRARALKKMQALIQLTN